jgi:hypothetical protein
MKSFLIATKDNEQSIKYKFLRYFSRKNGNRQSFNIIQDLRIDEGFQQQQKTNNNSSCPSLITANSSATTTMTFSSSTSSNSNKIGYCLNA